MTRRPLKVGDRVVLQHSRNVMTVIQLREVGVHTEALCHWVVGELPRTIWFRADQLEPAPSGWLKKLFMGLFGALYTGRAKD